MKRRFEFVNRNFYRMMGRNKKQNKNGQGKGNNNNNEGDEQNIEGKCAHVQECVKFNNLNNTIPHADLTKCSECSMLIDSPNQESNDQKLENVEESANGPDLTQTDKTPDAICVCLRCGIVACSRQSSHQHAVQHNKSKPSHSLAVNLSNWVVWCYQCDDEIDVEATAALVECLSLLKKALGLKAGKQEKHTGQPQKKNSSNIYSFSGKIPSVRGLSNLGNTCFFNSVMQNLCQSQLFRVAMNHLGANDFDFYVLPSGDNKELMPLLVTVTDKPGPLTSALAKFLQDMTSEGKKGAISPGHLFSEICKKAPRFKGFRQQDSQELLRYLLHSVRTEEIKGVKRAILRSFGIKSSQNEDGIKVDKVDEDVHEKIRVYGRNARAPVIDTLFCGQLVSSVECCRCHKVSTIMESFLDLSLSLATYNNIAPSKQQNTVAATTKKKQPPAAVTKHNNSVTKQNNSVTKQNNSVTKQNNSVTKQNNSVKKVEKKVTEEKTNAPSKVSKHQQKKMKKEARRSKKRGRKRQNSTSSTGRKQSEADEDAETDDEENKDNSNNDVIENLASDVTEIPADDVTETSVSDVLGTSVESDLLNVKENVLMNLAKVGDKTESGLNHKVGEYDVSMTSQHDVIDTSQVTATAGNEDAEMTTGNNDQQDNPTLNSVEVASAVNLEGKNDLAEENRTKNEDNVNILKQECFVKNDSCDNITETKANEISNDEDIEIPARKNGISLQNQSRDIDNDGDDEACCGSALDSQTYQEESLQKDNGNDVLNCAENEQQDCQNNDLTSKNIARDCSESDFDENSFPGEELNGDYDKNVGLLQSNGEQLLNSSHKGKQEYYTSLESNEISNTCDGNNTSTENDEASLTVNGEAELVRPNCETFCNTNSGISNSVTNEQTGPSEYGSADGTRLKRDTQISVDKASENDGGNGKLDSNINSQNPSHVAPAPVTEVENNEANKTISSTLPNQSSDNNDKDISNLSQKDPICFSKAGKTCVDEMTDRQSDNFIENKSTAISQNSECKNANESHKVRAYADEIADGTIQSVLHNISAGSSEEKGKETSHAKVKNDMSSEDETTNEKFSLEQNILNVECRDSVGETHASSPLNENNLEKFVESESTLPSFEAPKSLSLHEDNKEIQEYTNKMADVVLKESYHSISTTRKNKGVSEVKDISKDESSESGKLENDGTNGTTIDSQNLEADLEPDDVSPNSKSEILCGNHSLGSMDEIRSNVMSVESCLKKFCTPEMLEGNNMFICEQCNQHESDDEETEEKKDETKDEDSNDDEDAKTKKKSKRKTIYTEAVKQLLINQAPPVLTLHLKRFHQVGYSLKKIAKHVDFPLELNLAPFCHKSCKLATDSEGKVLYSLFGIVEHSGSLHSGHYTAYCRVPTVPSSLFDTKFKNLTQLLEVMDQMWIQGGKRESYVHEEYPSSRWFHISDSHVSEVGLERVLKSQAYLLFYERMVLSHGGEN